jgi:serine protein kinase
MTELFSRFREVFDGSRVERMSLEGYLDLCRTDRMAYASAAERMVAAIGQPRMLDTSADPRLARIFLNRMVRVYPAFSDFYGMEDAIERVVGYFRHAAQGLEERKQVLYLLGPVGGGKSSIAERLKELMEKLPLYVLCAGEQMSPVFESPLGLFPAARYGDVMQRDYGIDARYLTAIPSPWAIKRLREFDGDLSKFSVARVMPSRLEQIAVVKTEPGDENNQDISSLVGKTDIRMLERFSQNDPTATPSPARCAGATRGWLSSWRCSRRRSRRCIPC